MPRAVPCRKRRQPSAAPARPPSSPRRRNRRPPACTAQTRSRCRGHRTAGRAARRRIWICRARSKLALHRGSGFRAAAVDPRRLRLLMLPDRQARYAPATPRCRTPAAASRTARRGIRPCGRPGTRRPPAPRRLAKSTSPRSRPSPERRRSPPAPPSPRLAHATQAPRAKRTARCRRTSPCDSQQQNGRIIRRCKRHAHQRRHRRETGRPPSTRTKVSSRAVSSASVSSAWLNSVSVVRCAASTRGGWCSRSVLMRPA